MGSCELARNLSRDKCCRRVRSGNAMKHTPRGGGGVRGAAGRCFLSLGPPLTGVEAERLLFGIELGSLRMMVSATLGSWSARAGRKAIRGAHSSQRPTWHRHLTHKKIQIPPFPTQTWLCTSSAKYPGNDS